MQNTPSFDLIAYDDAMRHAGKKNIYRLNIFLIKSFFKFYTTIIKRLNNSVVND